MDVLALLSPTTTIHYGLARLCMKRDVQRLIASRQGRRACSSLGKCVIKHFLTYYIQYEVPIMGQVETSTQGMLYSASQQSLYINSGGITIFTCEH